jgi:hypothetical protein
MSTPIDRVPSRVVSCPKEQAQLSCRFSLRGPLPSPPRGGLDRLSPTFRYYEAIRLLSTLRHLVWCP